MAKLRSELPIHRYRLGQSPLSDAPCDRGDAPPIVVQFRASVFHVAASALYGLDGGEPFGSAAGLLLCDGFLSRKRDLHMFDLGAF